MLNIKVVNWKLVFFDVSNFWDWTRTEDAFQFDIDQITKLTTEGNFCTLRVSSYGLDQMSFLVFV